MGNSSIINERGAKIKLLVAIGLLALDILVSFLPGAIDYAVRIGEILGVVGVVYAIYMLSRKDKSAAFLVVALILLFVSIGISWFGLPILALGG